VTHFKAVGALRIERLDADRHDRSNFRCGEPSLDLWLRDDAPTAGRSSGVRIEVATIDNQVVGCYRLGCFEVEAGRPIERFGSQRPPRPAILVSWLGVDTGWQRRGLGTSLMVRAIRFANDAAPAIDAALLVACAEGDPAIAFCTRFGFEPFRGEAGWLYLRLRDVEGRYQVRVVGHEGPAAPARPRGVRSEPSTTTGSASSWPPQDSGHPDKHPTLSYDDQLEALRILVDRRDELTRARVQTINRRRSV
jgi:GNAT superfamily N-acetyltransferase